MNVERANRMKFMENMRKINNDSTKVRIWTNLAESYLVRIIRIVNSPLQ